MGIRVNSDSWTGRGPGRAAIVRISARGRLIAGMFSLVSGGFMLGMAAYQFFADQDGESALFSLALAFMLTVMGANHVREGAEQKVREASLKDSGDAR